MTKCDFFLLALRAALGHDFLFFWLNWIEAQARKLHNSFIQHGDKQPVITL